MGRGYKTAKADFSQDFVYQPPWELIAKAAEMKQNQYDTSLKETSMLNDLLKVNHIDEEIENSKVSQEKQLWEEQIKEVTNEIKKTGNYRKLMPRIREIQKGVMQSREDGNIAKFEQSAAIRDKHLKAIQEAIKKGGDIVGANRAYRTFLDKWMGQENRSLDGTLGYEELIKKPEALNYDKMFEQISKLDPELSKKIRKTPDGKGYIINAEGSEKALIEDRIMQLVSSKIGQDQNILPYFEQRSRFGLSKGVYDKNKKSLNIVKKYEDVFDKKGEKIGSKPILYDNELTSFLTGFNAQAYKEREDIVEYSNDSNLNSIRNRAQKAVLQNQRLKHKEKMADRKLNEAKESDMRKLQLKVAKGKGTEEERNLVNNYFSAGKILFLKDPNIKEIFDLKRDTKGALTESSKAKLNNLFYTDKNIDSETKDEVYRLIENNGIKNSSDLKVFLFKKNFNSFKDFLNSRPEIKKLGVDSYNNFVKISRDPSNPHYNDPIPQNIRTYREDYKKLSRGDIPSFYTEHLDEIYNKKGSAIINNITEAYNKVYADKQFGVQLFKTDRDIVSPREVLEEHLENIDSFDVYFKGADGKLKLVTDNKEDYIAHAEENLSEIGYTGLSPTSIGSSFNTVIKTKDGKGVLLVPKQSDPYLQVREENILTDKGSFSSKNGKGLNILKNQIKDRKIINIVNDIKAAAPDKSKMTDIEPIRVKGLDMIFKEGQFEIWSKEGNLIDTVNETALKNFLRKKYAE